MIPTYVNWIANEIKDRLYQRGYASRLIRQSRSRVSFLIPGQEAEIGVTIDTRESNVWILENGAAFEWWASGFYYPAKERKGWNCLCGSEGCADKYFATRRELLEEYAIGPVLTSFELFGQGAFLDYFGSIETGGFVCLRKMGEPNPESPGYKKSLWVAPSTLASQL